VSPAGLAAGTEGFHCYQPLSRAYHMTSNINHLFTGLVLIAVSGCGATGTGLEVSGTVTSGGQPVENATILFAPERDAPGPAVGSQVLEGRFLIKAVDGLQQGRYVVTVTLGGVPSRKEAFGRLRNPSSRPYRFAREITRDKLHIDIELTAPKSHGIAQLARLGG
jgi:hypothetical protein